MERPEWWDWELAFTSHVEMRMEERGFTEVDLRGMLDNAVSVERSGRGERWIVSARHGGRSWKIVLEPDADERITNVVTAYAREAR